MRDMESSVLRRETIITRGEIQQKLPQTKAVMQSTVQKKIVDLQRKIREGTQVSVYRSIRPLTRHCRLAGSTLPSHASNGQDIRVCVRACSSKRLASSKN